MITETYGKTVVVVNGVETEVQQEIPTFVYNGATQIMVDDTIEDGYIAVVEDGAFGVGQHWRKKAS
jgi:hypothetical protein